MDIIDRMNRQRTKTLLQFGKFPSVAKEHSGLFIVIKTQPSNKQMVCVMTVFHIRLYHLT